MMNRHGASNSTRSEDPGQLFSALMSDSGPNQGTFVPGSNAFSLSHYQNMPNDQVDWAALAQQWIKMRETWIQPMPSLMPSPPPPPPSFDRDTYGDGAGVNDTPHPANRIGAPVAEFEEQGEAPMEVERDDDGDVPVPPAPPKISGDWSASADDAWRTWSWPPSMNSATTLDENHVPQSLPNNQKHADQQQTALASDTTTITTATTATVGPVVASASPSAAAAIALWQAKNSHLFQGGGYAKDTTATRQPQTPTWRVFSTKPKPPVRLPGLMDREIKMGLSASSAVAATDVQRVDTKENSFSTSVASGAATINEEKRMMLPAWIREGLEKMERDKQQKLKREQEYRQREEKLSSQQNLQALALSPTREELIPPLNVQQQVQEEPQAPHQTTVPLKEQDVEQTTKRILTEVFMDTTNEVLLSIAKEELSKVQKRKAKQAATSNVGLATYTRGLGLGIYGDSDEDEEEEDEEEQPTNEGSKNAAGGGTYANSDLDSANNSDDDDSDTEAMRKMMDKIRTRQQSFKSTASQIEKWLGDVSDTVSNSTEPNQKQKVPTSDTDASDDDEEEEDGTARYDAHADSDPERESPSRHGKMNTGNGFGAAQYTLFVARQTDKASGSQENVRKRRDKRVSRFSDPRDTVRTTHITHVSILSNPAESVRPTTKGPEPSPATNVPVATTPATSTTIRQKQVVAPEAKPRQQSYNSYMQQLHSYQTIYSISAGHRAAQAKANETDDSRRKHNVDSEASLGSDGGGDAERKSQHYHDRKKSYAEENDSGTSRARRDEGSDSYRKRYRDRSHSRSSRGSRSSASRSGSADSLSTRSTLSPSSHASDHRRSSSSSKRPRYNRDRSSDRRSRSSGSSSRRHHRSKHSRSPSRSRSSSKYSSRRRF